MTLDDLIRATRAALHPGSASAIAIPGDDPEIITVEIIPSLHYFSPLQMSFHASQWDDTTSAERRSIIAERVVQCAPWSASNDLLAAYTRAQLIAHAIQEARK
jgi:hypothetical protein